MIQVPFLDLKAQHAQVKEEILPLWAEIIETAGFVGGKHVSGLEDEFAAACGVKHCVAVSNGTDALAFLLKSFRLSKRDEVILPVNTFIATAEAVSMAGATAVFVDVLPDTYAIDPCAAEAAITARTNGIIPVHLYGQMASMDEVSAVAAAHGLWVVEDAAQAHLAEYKGRKAGTVGLGAGFSFYPGKNLGACGDAGAVTTNDDAIAAYVRKIRDHGSAQKYYHEFEGCNGRCDAMQAAALRVKLQHLPQWNAARRKVAQRYCDRLSEVKEVVLPVVNPDCLPVWHLFVIQVDHRDDVRKGLADRGIATDLHYPVPLHLQEAYVHFGLRKGTFPVAESVAERLLSLPMFAELTEGQVDAVCDALVEVVSSQSASKGMPLRKAM